MQRKEHAGCHNESRAFVSIQERVISSDAHSIRCREVGDIRSPVCREILWPGESRQQQGFISQPFHAAVLRKLLVMDCKNHIFFYPAPFLAAHFASSRKTSRRSPMNRRAKAICSSKSGLYGVIRTPSGDSVRKTESPFCTFSSARASLGKTIPAELPIVVTLSLIMSASVLMIITSIRMRPNYHPWQACRS